MASSHVRASLVLLCVLSASGCAPARRARQHAIDAAAADGGAKPAMPIWTTITAPLDLEPRTAALSLTLPGAHALAIRTYGNGAAADSFCFQLESVVANGDQPWVGVPNTDDYGDYCIRCAQRVSVGAGYGFFVLPSAADAGSSLTSLDLRVALRDCTTLTPLDDDAPRPESLIVEHASWDPPPSAAQLRLPLAIAIATPYAFAVGDTLLSDALANAQTTWRAAGIDLSITQTVVIDRPPAPVVYSATDRSALSSLSRSARTALAATASERAWPIVIMAPCLRREDVITGGRSEPLSITPHVPGGFAVGDEPDEIFIAGERCAGLEPGANFIDSGTLGAVLAHEVGHYLGLYHVEEVDGRQDSLMDTSPADPNLMQAMPNAQSLALTDSQIAIARRHIAFASARAPQP